MNETYDLRQELNQPSISLNKQEGLTELKTKLQYLEKENQSLKDENENKRRRIETALNQNNELLKLNHEIYNKNNVTHYQEKSIKECSKQDDFQVASKTSTKKIKQSLEKDMDNNNNNNCFISPNRFGRLFYEDNNNDDNESITNNTDSTKSLLNHQINKENFAKKYNNNDKNKNTGRPEVVINQYPENQMVYPRKRIVPGTNSYSESLGNSQINSRNIKIFSDSIPKGIRIKQMKQQIKNGNARIHSFPGATSHQLLHYLDENLDKYTDTVVIHIGINDILNSASNVNGLLSNIKDMIKKCRNFGVKYIFASGLVYTKRTITEFLEDVHLKLVSVCKEMQVYFIDNRNITGFYLFRDGLHLPESGKKLLANNFVSNFNNFLSVKHRPNLFPYAYNDDMNEISSVDESCDTPLLLRNLKLKNTNRLILGHLNINSIVGKFDHLKVLIENNIDILVLTETKINASFPNAQFRIDGFSAPFRLDRNRFGGGVLIYVREDIPCKQLNKTYSSRRHRRNFR